MKALRRLREATARRVALARSARSIRREIAAGLARQERAFAPSPRPLGDAVLSVEIDPAIPQLAWLAARDRRGYRFLLGRSVERFADGFFEGAWSGPFEDFASAARGVCYGSGALFAEDGPVFIQRSDIREFTFLLRDRAAGVDYVSNSLCFALAAAGVDLEGAFFARAAALAPKTAEAVTRGFHGMDPRVAETGDYSLHRICYARFRLDERGRPVFDKDVPLHDFADFAAYRGFLLDTTRAVVANAASPARARPLSPLCTVSRGYDSPAAAALARACGARAAATIEVDVHGMSDCGADIAEALGLDCAVFPHVMARRVDALRAEAAGTLGRRAQEFVATAGMGDDVTYASFEPALEGRLLVTGASGDAVLERRATPRVGLRKTNPFECSMTEFRLRLGFAHYTPFVAGAVSTAAILRVSQSAEMRPWRVGKRYDRPIARRIAEEAGVPRGAFGLSKRATAPDFTNRAALWAEAVRAVTARYVHARPG